MGDGEEAVAHVPPLASFPSKCPFHAVPFLPRAPRGSPRAGCPETGPALDSRGGVASPGIPKNPWQRGLRRLPSLNPDAPVSQEVWVPPAPPCPPLPPSPPPHAPNVPIPKPSAPLLSHTPKPPFTPPLVVVTAPIPHGRPRSPAHHTRKALQARCQSTRPLAPARIAAFGGATGDQVPTRAACGSDGAARMDSESARTIQPVSKPEVRAPPRRGHGR